MYTYKNQLEVCGLVIALRVNDAHQLLTSCYMTAQSHSKPLRVLGSGSVRVRSSRGQRGNDRGYGADDTGLMLPLWTLNDAGGLITNM